MSSKTLNLEHASIYVAESSPTDGKFEVWGTFYDAVPVSEDMPTERAQDLNTKVAQAINTRLSIFTKLLDLALRQDKLQPWQEIDVALTALGTQLEWGGLRGALETIRPEVERANSPK